MIALVQLRLLPYHVRESLKLLYDLRKPCLEGLRDEIPKLERMKSLLCFQFKNQSLKVTVIHVLIYILHRLTSWTAITLNYFPLET